MKKILTLLILLGGAAAGLVVWQPWADETPTGPSVDRAIAETVSVRTLTDEITVRGELRRDQLQTITSATAGQDKQGQDLFHAQPLREKWRGTPERHPDR